MATYYVNYVDGNDANNGLGPDASHATNKPWKTIGKLLGASGMASGDFAWLAPVTFREAMSVAMTSPAAETIIQADYENSQGFKTAAGVLLPPGDTFWTPYDTNDTTLPSGTNPPLSLAGRDNLTFRDIILVCGRNTTNQGINASTTNSQNIKFQRCFLLPGIGSGGSAITYTGTAGQAANWLIEGCGFLGTSLGAGIVLTLPIHTSEYDINFVVQNCHFVGYTDQIYQNLSGTPGSLAYGLIIRNNTHIGASARTIRVYTSTATAMTNPGARIENCLILGGATAGIGAGATSQVVEDYNDILSITPRSNVSAGANSTSDGSKAMLLHTFQTHLQNRQPRPYGMPFAGSPVLGFGNASGAPTTDLLGRPRPAGGQSTANAVGCFERHDTAAQETGTVQAGSNAIVIVGPGDHDIQIPVDATSTTISIYVRYDTTHAATNKPQVALLANGEIGYAGQTLTMSAAVDTWEQLTFTAFTPAQKSVVTLRLISRAAAGGGKAFFDTVAGGAQGTQGLDYFRGNAPFVGAVAAGGGGTTVYTMLEG